MQKRPCLNSLTCRNLIDEGFQKARQIPSPRLCKGKVSVGSDESFCLNSRSMIFLYQFQLLCYSLTAMTPKKEVIEVILLLIVFLSVAGCAKPAYRNLAHPSFGQAEYDQDRDQCARVNTSYTPTSTSNAP